MAKKENTEEVMTCDSFVNIYLNNPRESFYLKKKFGQESKTTDEWLMLAKKEDLTLNNLQ